MASTTLTNAGVVDAWLDWTAEAGFISSENTFHRRLLLFWLRSARSKLIKEKMKRESLSKFMYQTIPCIELEEVDQSECPCAPASGCTFLKTKEPIPQFLYLSSVTSLLGNITYNHVEWDKIRYKTSSRFSALSSKPYWTMKNTGDGSHLYLYNSRHLKKISVTGIFDDPLAVQCFPNENGEIDCCTNPWDQEFIIDGDLLSLMFDLAMSSMMRFKSQNSDTIMNNVDDTTNNQSNLK